MTKSELTAQLLDGDINITATNINLDLSNLLWLRIKTAFGITDLSYMNAGINQNDAVEYDLGCHSCVPHIMQPNIGPTLDIRHGFSSIRVGSRNSTCRFNLQCRHLATSGSINSLPCAKSTRAPINLQNLAATITI